jgi:4-hydroxy-tetrahydrodipicolinate synthase
MAMVGRDSGELRLPMTNLEEAESEKLRETLAAYGIQSVAKV